MIFLTSLRVFVGLCIMFKIYIKLTTGIYRGKQKLYGKTVIVTGANTGIGYVSAMDFAHRGAKVLIVCRNMDKAKVARIKIIEETGNSNVHVYQVDFSSLVSVRKGANEILNKEDRIDVLLNNAGASDAGYDQVTKEGLNVLMTTNYYGPFLFTNILLGKIKMSAPSRIVNVSSNAHHFSGFNKDNIKTYNILNSYKLYMNSKLGNILFTNELARKISGSGVCTNSLHPGVFASEIARDKNILLRFLWEKALNAIFFKSVEEGAQTSIYLCVSPEVANISGKYFADCKLSESSEKSTDLDFARALWDFSEKAVNLQPEEKHY